MWWFELRPKYLYIVDDDIKCFTGAKLNALFLFHDNAFRVYIIESDV